MFPYDVREEVIKLKFGDIIIATASIIVICILISFPLALVLTPATGSYNNAYELSGFIVFFLGPLITGYVFAKQIREEDRTKTILKIAVLVAFIAMFMVLADDAAVEWAPYYRAEYLKTNPTATPTAFEWYSIQLAALGTETFGAAAIMLVFTFIGLYIGSQLKKPTKTT